MKILYRTGGQSLDSLDMYHAGFISLNPGSYQYSIFGTTQNSYTSFMNRLGSPFLSSSKSNFKYSALPHLGFMYSFGSKGIQMLNLEYQQFFTKKFGLNLSYKRSSLGEMMRNGEAKTSDLFFATKFCGKRFKNFTSFSFQQAEMDQNGGLDSTEALLSFPLQFLSVKKTNAKSTLKNFSLESEHYFNFTKDSLREFGLSVKEKWTISNRVYEESGDLSSIYSHINIDSSTTRDQFQFAEFTNFGGFYIKNKIFNAQFYASSSYWDYQNLAKHQDTTKFSLHGNLELKFGKFILSDQAYLNLVGAVGEKFNRLNIKTENQKIKANLFLNLEQKLPDLFQRSYFSNNNYWHLSTLTTQNLLDIGFNAQVKSKIESFVQVRYQQFSNYYFFFDSTWRNDTLSSFNLLNIQAKSNFKLKNFLFQPFVNLNLKSKELNFIPQLDLRMRIAYNKKLFEAKKMDYIIGLDINYKSSNDLLNYQNSLDVFSFSSSNLTTNKGFYKLDFFTGFQIETFRFYIKAENIASFWNKVKAFDYVGIPKSPFYLRIGLTWDFFN